MIFCKSAYGREASSGVAEDRAWRYPGRVYQL